MKTPKGLLLAGSFVRDFVKDPVRRSMLIFAVVVFVAMHILSNALAK